MSQWRIESLVSVFPCSVVADIQCFMFLLHALIRVKVLLNEWYDNKWNNRLVIFSSLHIQILPILVVLQNPPSEVHALKVLIFWIIHGFNMRGFICLIALFALLKSGKVSASTTSNLICYVFPWRPDGVLLKKKNVYNNSQYLNISPKWNLPRSLHLSQIMKSLVKMRMT